MAMRPFLLGLLLLVTLQSATAQTFVLESDGVYRGHMGMSVAIDGNYIFAGNGIDAVYIFSKSEGATWTFDQKIEMPFTVNYKHAVSIAADGGRLLVGLFDGSNERGGAFVYMRQPDVGWVLESALFPDGLEPDPDHGGAFLAGSNYGESVSLDGEYAVVGAPGRIYTSGPGLGVVYVFHRDPVQGWAQVAKLAATPETDDDGFGTAVAIDKDMILIGAPTQYISHESGRAYVFQRNSEQQWNQVATIQASDAEENDAFGISVDILDNHAVVGAPTFSRSYIFHSTSPELWTEVRRLEQGEDGFFGASVALHADYALIGSARRLLTGGLSGGGNAYLYRFDVASETWSLEDKYRGHNRGPDDGHGAAVTLDDELLVVGVPYQTRSDSEEGAVYLYRIGTSPDPVESNRTYPLENLELSSYPNPSHGPSHISFSIPDGELNRTRLSVFDLLGRELAVLVDDRLPPGPYAVEWTDQHVPAGVYFCRLSVGEKRITHAIILAR
jgi:hypothetical protein